MKNHAKLLSQPGARRLAVALALCAALLMCLGQAALAKTAALEGFTFTLPDAFEKGFSDSSAFNYWIDNDEDFHGLTVGIGHCNGEEKRLGLTLDWIYEQLEKGDGEYMQNLIHGQPTLFLQAVDEEAGVSYALVGITMNDAYIIGVERQTETTQPVGDILLEVMSSAKVYTPEIRKGVSSFTPQPTAEPTPEPTPELTLGQKVSIEGFTFSVPDAFEQDIKDDNGFIYSSIDAPTAELGVGIGHCYDIEEFFGVSLDWIYEQLDKGDGENMQNLVHGQPTLFLQTADEDASYALAAIKLNGSYIIGGEARQTAQPAGDLLLKVLSSVEIHDPQVTKDVASVTEEPPMLPVEPTPEPTAEPTLGQKVTIGGFTFAVPDEFEQVLEDDDNGFAYSDKFDSHVLAVGIGHCYDIEDTFGVSLDWIYEQLDKGDGEHMQNLIHGQPTLFLQTADEDRSYALAAIKMNGSYIIGGEGQADTQSTGDLLLEVLSSVESPDPQVTKDVANVTEEPTAEPAPTPLPAASNGSLLPVYHPDDCQAWSYNETCLHYLDCFGGREATDDFLFCGLDWDTDLDTALRTIAANTNRQMEDAGNGSYMGVNYDGSPFWGLNSNECFLTLISVISEENGWWVECQLTPEQIVFEDEQEAAAWFTRVWQSLDWEEHEPSTYTFELEGQGQAVGSAEELISLWQDAAAGDAESVYAFVTFNNLTLSLEKDLYGDESYISCWLALVPGER